LIPFYNNSLDRGKTKKTLWQEMCHEPSSPKESNNLKAFARLHKQKFKDMMFENEIKV
jgi:hypothetical protein